jgi:hypothetical protein
MVGVDITRRTLLNYETNKLISEPKRGGGGPGGRWTDYPAGTVEEARAAWQMLHGKYPGSLPEKIFDGKPPTLSPEMISIARRLAHRVYLEKNNLISDKTINTVPTYSEIKVESIDAEGFMDRARQIFYGASDEYNGQYGIVIGNSVVTVDNRAEASVWYSMMAACALLHLLLCIDAARIKG